MSPSSRKFRHFFRNAYVLDLDSLRVRTRADELVAIEVTVTEALTELTRHIEAALTSLK